MTLSLHPNKPAIKPRILLINRLYPPARASSGRLVRELARSFARDGWDVRVLTTDMIASDDPDGPVAVRRIPTNLQTLGVIANLWLLCRLFLAAMWLPRAQIVITLTDPPLLVIVGAWVAFLRGARHIHWVQDVYPDLLPAVGYPLPGWLDAMLYRATRRAMNRAARVVVIGRCMARYLTQHGVRGDRMTLIPNWPELAMNPHIPTRPISAFAPEPPVITPPLLPAEPKFRILYVGTVGFAHPIDTIMDAATILESTHPEMEFIFIGDAPAHALVGAERAKRGLNNIRVLPFQPQSRLRDIMESGDVHVISMKHAAAGMMVPAKFYAALSAARPCIFVGPEHTEIARVITDYRAGVVIPQGAAQQLAQAIIDYRLREDVWFTAQGGATKAAAAFTPEDMIRLWLRKTRDVMRVAQGIISP